MKNIFIKVVPLLLFNLLHHFTKAQYDTIRYVNGVRQAAKIMEINEKTVRFKNPKDTLGPVYVVKIKYIEKFILKDGCIDLKKEGYLNCVKDPTFGVIKNEDFTKNIISLDMLQLINMHLQVSAEHIFKRRTFGIAGYFNKGFFDGTDSITYNRLECKINGGTYYKQNYGGLDFKFYPYLHKRITFWIALGAEYGKASNQLVNSILVTQLSGNGYQSWNNYYTTFYYSYKERQYLGYHVSSGFLLRIVKNFICQGNISVGVSQFGTDWDPAIKSNPHYNYYPKVSVGLLVGLAF